MNHLYYKFFFFSFQVPIQVPVENCIDVPKENCHKVTDKLAKEVCNEGGHQKVAVNQKEDNNVVFFNLSYTLCK